MRDSAFQGECPPAVYMSTTIRDEYGAHQASRRKYSRTRYTQNRSYKVKTAPKEAKGKDSEFRVSRQLCLKKARSEFAGFAMRREKQ